MTKTHTYEIGDKVRANATSNGEYALNNELNGFEGEVMEVRSSGFARVKTTKSNLPWEIGRSYTVLLKHFDLIESASQPIPKLSKNQRIAALELKVSELYEKLAKPESDKHSYSELSANAQRASIIKEAQKFVKDLKERANDGRVADIGHEYYRGRRTVSYLTVKPEERKVIAVVKGAVLGKEFNRATTVCAPTDVFNVDIGKAIALGRAYGSDVARFENAIQPDAPTEGMVVASKPSSVFESAPYVVQSVEGGRVYDKPGMGWLTVDTTLILEDTDAKYGV